MRVGLDILKHLSVFRAGSFDLFFQKVMIGKPRFEQDVRQAFFEVLHLVFKFQKLFFSLLCVHEFATHCLVLFNLSIEPVPFEELPYVDFVDHLLELELLLVLIFKQVYGVYKCFVHFGGVVALVLLGRRSHLVWVLAWYLVSHCRQLRQVGVYIH